MSNQILPNTDSIVVTKIAAAVAAVIQTKQSPPSTNYTLEQWLEKFDQAYKAISATVEG